MPSFAEETNISIKLPCEYIKINNIKLNNNENISRAEAIIHGIILIKNRMRYDLRMLGACSQ